MTYQEQSSQLVFSNTSSRVPILPSGLSQMPRITLKLYHFPPDIYLRFNAQSLTGLVCQSGIIVVDFIAPLTHISSPRILLKLEPSLTYSLTMLPRFKGQVHLFSISIQHKRRLLLAGGMKLVSNGLAIAKECLGVGLVDIGAKIIAQLASKQETLIQSAKSNDASNALHIRYLMLRVDLAWKQDRLAFADHFYVQLESFLSTFQPDDRERFGDMCYEIGIAQLDKDQNGLARLWLQRGCAVCSSQSYQNEDVDLSDLLLNLTHTYVRSLLESHDPEAEIEAFERLESLRAEFGHRLPVILLQLEVYARDPAPNLDAYLEGLAALIRSIHLIPSNHTLILHHIHQLKALSVANAARLLKSYILTRLIDHDENQWVECAIVTLIWLVTGNSNEPTPLLLLDLESSLNEVHKQWNKTFTLEATHGALVLLWKRIDSCNAIQASEDTVGWCKLALHPLFSNAGDYSVGKLERKMIKCFLDLSEIDAAMTVFQHMADHRKNHHLSQFLWYSLALRRKDDNTVQSALNALAMAHDDRNRLLFAAVSEAMKHGTKRHGAHLLQRILDKYKHSPSSNLDIPALLRSTTRLLLSAIAEEEGNLDELLSRLCGVFRSAVAFSRELAASKSAPSAATLEQCRWFVKVSYNTALEHAKDWPARYVVELLHYSCQIICPESSTNPQSAIEKVVHEIKASQVQTILYIGEARSCPHFATIEDIPKSSYCPKSPPSGWEIKRTLYRNVFEKYSHSRLLLGTLSEQSPDEHVMGDLRKGMVTVIPFAFESVLFLSLEGQSSPVPIDEASLGHLIEDTACFQTPHKTFSLIADMILSATRTDETPIALDEPDGIRTAVRRCLPVTTAATLLNKLIGNLRTHVSYDIHQASRWIRCVVQVVLDKTTVNICKNDAELASALTMVKGITEQALELAMPLSASRDYARSHGPVLADYPSEEIEWLATTLFNLSIDLHYAQKSHGRREASETKGPCTAGAEERQAFACSRSKAETVPVRDSNSGPRLESGDGPDTKAAGTVRSQDAPGRMTSQCGNLEADVDLDLEVAQPQIWARLAVRLADLLDPANRGSPLTAAECASEAPQTPTTTSAEARLEVCEVPYGDGGALARALRQRFQLLGWHI